MVNLAAYTSDPLTFPALLERLHSEQFTGAITIQFGQGVPNVVEFPRLAPSIKLDKAPKPL